MTFGGRISEDIRLPGPPVTTTSVSPGLAEMFTDDRTAEQTQMATQCHTFGAFHVCSRR